MMFKLRSRQDSKVCTPDGRRDTLKTLGAMIGAALLPNKGLSEIQGLLMDEINKEYDRLRCEETIPPDDVLETVFNSVYQVVLKHEQEKKKKSVHYRSRTEHDEEKERTRPMNVAIINATGQQDEKLIKELVELGGLPSSNQYGVATNQPDELPNANRNRIHYEEVDQATMRAIDDLIMSDSNVVTNAKNLEPIKQRLKEMKKMGADIVYLFVPNAPGPLGSTHKYDSPDPELPHVITIRAHPDLHDTMLESTNFPFLGNTYWTADHLERVFEWMKTNGWQGRTLGKRIYLVAHEMSHAILGSYHEVTATPNNIDPRRQAASIRMTQPDGNVVFYQSITGTRRSQVEPLLQIMMATGLGVSQQGCMIDITFADGGKETIELGGAYMNNAMHTTRDPNGEQPLPGVSYGPADFYAAKMARNDVVTNVSEIPHEQVNLKHAIKIGSNPALLGQTINVKNVHTQAFTHLDIWNISGQPMARYDISLQHNGGTMDFDIPLGRSAGKYIFSFYNPKLGIASSKIISIL